MTSNIYALVPCAGTGSRAGRAGPKQYENLAGEALVMHTVRALLSVPRIRHLLLVLAPHDRHGQALFATPPARLQCLALGGRTRAESVFNGLCHLRQQGVADDAWVLVHDAARCLVTADEICHLLQACEGDAVGGLLALPLPDTLKQEAAGRVQKTCPREHKWLAQTPQMFRLGALYAALGLQRARAFAGVTDEASAMEMAGHHPLLVRGSAHNIKVTYPEDFALAEAVLRSR